MPPSRSASRRITPSTSTAPTSSDGAAPLPPSQVPLHGDVALLRTALEIAVDNENVEIVQFLLEQPGIRVGNALLGAIREGVYGLVEILINHPSISTEMLGSSAFISSSRREG